MKKALISAVATLLISTFALTASAQQSQQCPEGYHYDAAQQKCVKHGN